MTMSTTTEISIATIDGQCKAYAAKRQLLSERVSALEAELSEVKKRHLTGIKSAAASCQDLQADLRATIEGAPQLFTKPKTYTLHGVKVGFVKGKGKLTWDIEDDELVKRIKKFYAQEAREVLIVTVEKPSKDALANLPASELKRLGITVGDVGDQVVVKTTDTEIDKLVAKMLDEGAKPTEEGN